MKLTFENQLHADFPHVVTVGLPGCYLPDEVITTDNRDDAIEVCDESILDYLESDCELTDSAVETLHDEAMNSIRETGIATVKNRQWSCDISQEDHELLAIARHDGVQPDEVSEQRFDHYGLRVFSVGNREYAIGTDLESDEACREAILESLWAFNADFLAPYTVLTAAEIEACRGDRCEDFNPAAIALVGDQLDDLVDDAIGLDGRGRFLSNYDGDETEISIADEQLFVYRIN